MTRLLTHLLFCFSLIGCGVSKNDKQAVIQQPIYVYDFENILTQEQEEQLFGLILQHERKTSNEIAIVTTSSWEPHINIDEYSVAFGNEKGVGKADKDNGIVISFSRTMRATRISTGLGLENILTDEKAQLIIDSLMLPAFREGEFYRGIRNGTQAIINFLELPENQVE